MAVRTGRMSARVASGCLSHLAERRVVVAVRAEDVALPLHPGREVEKLEVIKRTLQLLVQFDVTILRQGKCLVALENNVVDYDDPLLFKNTDLNINSNFCCFFGFIS